MRLKNSIAGFTLIELVITIVITGVLGITVVVVTTNMARSDKQTMDIQKNIASLEPLNEAFTGLVRQAAADTDSPSNQAAFVITGTELKIYTFTVENDPGSYTYLGRIYLNGTNIRFVRALAPVVAEPGSVVCRNVTSLAFALGPYTDTTVNNYGGYKTGLNKRSVLMTVTIVIGDQTLTHAILAHAPNVKAES